MSSGKIQLIVKGSNLEIDILEESLSGDNNIIEELNLRKISEADIAMVSIDMKSITYINSTGISEIISIFKRFKQASIHNFKLELVNVNPRVNAILELVEISNIARIKLQ